MILLDEAAERGLFAEWALGNLKVNRDLVKSNTMTKVYDADERGAMAKQNFEHEQFAALMADEPRLELWVHHERYILRKYHRRATRLAKLVTDVVRETDASGS